MKRSLGMNLPFPLTSSSATFSPAGRMSLSSILPEVGWLPRFIAWTLTVPSEPGGRFVGRTLLVMCHQGEAASAGAVKAQREVARAAVARAAVVVALRGRWGFGDSRVLEARRRS